MKRDVRRPILVAVSLLVSAACLAFFVQRVWGHRAEMVQTLRQAHYRYLVPAVGMLAVLYYIRVRRWQLFLRPLARVPIGAVASATCIGFMANCVLPLRLGELARPYVLHRRTRLPFGQCVATSAGLERMFDVVGLAMIVALASLLLRGRLLLPVSRGTTQAVWAASGLFAVMACALVAGVAWLALAPRSFERAGAALARLLPERWGRKAEEFLRHLTDGVRFLRDWRGIALALLYSIEIWLAQGISTFYAARCLGAELSLAGALAVAAAVAVAVAAPQAPAYLGPFHAAAMLAAEAFRLGRGEAGALAILMWMVNVVPITVVGLGFLWYEGLSLRGLAAQSEQTEAAGEGGA